MSTFRTIPYLPALFLAFAAVIAPAQAHGYKAGDLTIGHPWTRATPGGAKVAAGYLTVTNGGKTADRLIGASVDGVGAVELHQMKVVDNVMTMREVKDGLEIKPGATVELAPGGHHMMMMGLAAPFKEGQMIKGTLRFEKAGTVPVEFKVEAMGATPSGEHDHHGDAHKGM